MPRIQSGPVTVGCFFHSFPVKLTSAANRVNCCRVTPAIEMGSAPTCPYGIEVQCVSVNPVFLWFWCTRPSDPHSPIDLIFSGLYLALLVLTIVSFLGIPSGGPFKGFRPIILCSVIPSILVLGNWSYIHSGGTPSASFLLQFMHPCCQDRSGLSIPSSHVFLILTQKEPQMSLWGVPPLPSWGMSASDNRGSGLY